MKRIQSIGLITAVSLSLAACGTPDNGDPTNQISEANAPGELLQSEVKRELAPQVDEAISAQLSADNRDFAFDLIEEIRSTDDDNIFFSPHSISIALAMTYPGTSGDTKSQLADVLRFNLDEDDLHSAFNSLDLDLATRSEVDVDEDDGDPPVLNVVNATWGQYDFPFAQDYLDTIALNYGAGLQGVNFLDDHDAIRLDINQWVEDQTNERIQDLLPEDSITPATRLVLTNAIYFLAGWKIPFPEYATSQASFHLLDGGRVDTAMMSNNDTFAFYADGTTNAVSLPYVGDELSLIALQPTAAEDFAEWEDSLHRDYFDDVVAGLSPAHGSVTFPSFEIEGEYNLQDLFSAMGWTDFADLRAMVEDGQGGLEITGILHKSFIKLDEEGTEAAAATAVIVGETSAPVNEYELRFNRPFYYAIYDHPTDSILFLGRIMNPAE